MKLTNLLTEILTRISRYEEQIEELGYDDITQRANERQIEVFFSQNERVNMGCKELN